MMLRHDRGKIGWEAEVCANTRMNAHSRVLGSAFIWESDLRNAQVLDTHIYQSRLINSITTNKQIVAGEIINSFISGEAVIQGTARRKAIIESSVIKDRVYIKGGSEIRGVILCGMMRIDSGLWERAPRYTEAENETEIFGVTEAQNGFVFVGCQKFLMLDLLKGRRRFQKIVNFSDETITFLAGIFEQWLDEPIRS